MNRKIIKRPKLNTILSPKLFKNYYWDKKELLHFCSANRLSTYGDKLDLINRIEHFLLTGQQMPFNRTTRPSKWDSDNTITTETRVVNYKNDAKTRFFFQQEIGSHFRFNSYLRQFAKNCNKYLNLTYGDLVKGWIQEEEQKKNPSYSSTIGKQFEFNKFQRDFYTKHTYFSQSNNNI